MTDSEDKPTKGFPFEDGDFAVDEQLLLTIAEYLKPETAVQVLDEWRNRFVAAIDAAVTRHKAEATAKAAAND